MAGIPQSWASALYIPLHSPSASSFTCKRLFSQLCLNDSQIHIPSTFPLTGQSLSHSEGSIKNHRGRKEQISQPINQEEFLLGHQFKFTHKTKLMTHFSWLWSQTCQPRPRPVLTELPTTFLLPVGQRPSGCLANCSLNISWTHLLYFVLILPQEDLTWSLPVSMLHTTSRLSSEKTILPCLTLTSGFLLTKNKVHLKQLYSCTNLPLSPFSLSSPFLNSTTQINYDSIL